MSQVIVRISSNENDVEMLLVDKGSEIWKKLSFKEFYSILRKRVPGAFKDSKPVYLDPCIIAAGEGVSIIKKPAHRRVVTYSGKAYEINFPNALYVIRHSLTKVNTVNAYTFFDWQGRNTALYLMPMPNMTSSERMCLGTAERTIRHHDLPEALERILDASYTHDHVDNMKQKTSTVKWFLYLKKNSVKKTDVKSAGITVADLTE